MKISIVTPCRNSVKTIERTIKSVVEQSSNVTELEYIIVDGQSDDGTLDIIKRYADEYSFIKYISEKDHSMTEALNKGFKLATGDIIASINADDIYLPDTLRKVKHAFEENDHPNIVLINTFFVDAESGRIKSKNTPKKFSPMICGFIECPFPECAIFFRKNVVKETGLFNEKMKYTQDFEYYLRAYDKGFRFSYYDIDGSCFYISSSNYSSIIGDKMRDEALTYFNHKWTYKYISGSWISKIIKEIFGFRHYYIGKNSQIRIQDVRKS